MHKPSSCLHFPLCLSLSDIYNVTAICENRSMIDHEASLSQGLKMGGATTFIGCREIFLCTCKLARKLPYSTSVVLRVRKREERERGKEEKLIKPKG